MIRVRFAPSPTGFLHVGNVRTALFNWLVARHGNGVFMLRIEDTDAERSRPEFEQQLISDLQWLGLEWDEGVGRGGPRGPYRQSDRYGLYQEYAQKLVAADRAFYCFCTEEELEMEREAQLARGDMPKYSGKCRQLSSEEVRGRRNAGEPASLRLHVRTGTVGFTDLVFGRIDIDTAQISDPVILRSDGSPTYNFSCVIDDSLMEITHVIRGEGHLSNTHRQILIYEAFGFATPAFAHLSTVLGPDGQKLSKRHGATSVEEFRVQGYLPEALANYLSLLGWSPPEEGKEILSLQEIVALFDLGRVSKSPAIFDRVKLDWMNRSYMGRMSPEDLTKAAEHYFVRAGLVPAHPDPAVSAWLTRVIDAVKTHVDHFDQLPETADIDTIYAFQTSPPQLDEEARQILGTPEARSVALEFLRLVAEREILTLDAYREILGQVKTATKQKGKSLFHPIRAALTGRGSGPELEKLIPIYEEGSRLSLPRPVMSCRQRLETVLQFL